MPPKTDDSRHGLSGVVILVALWAIGGIIVTALEWFTGAPIDIGGAFTSIGNYIDWSTVITVITVLLAVGYIGELWGKWRDRKLDKWTQAQVEVRVSREKLDNWGYWGSLDAETLAQETCKLRELIEFELAVEQLEAAVTAEEKDKSR